MILHHFEILGSLLNIHEIGNKFYAILIAFFYTLHFS